MMLLLGIEASSFARPAEDTVACCVHHVTVCGCAGFLHSISGMGVKQMGAIYKYSSTDVELGIL